MTGFNSKQQMATDKLRDCMHGKLARSCQICDLEAEVEELKKALAQPEQDSTYTYASSLATAIWQKHYMKESPKWKPLDTTEGVLTQIDNMTCGLIKEKPAQPEQEPVAWLLTDKNINSLQVDSIQRLIDRLRLTDEEIKKVLPEISQIPPIDFTTKTYAQAIEAKLKEKNT